MSPRFTQRSWLQFSLRSILVFVSILCVWLAWNVHQVRQRDRLLSSIRARGAWIVTAEDYQTAFRPPRRNPLKPPQDLPLLWPLLGVKPIELIRLPEGTFSDDEVPPLSSLFPEADVSIGSGNYWGGFF